MSTPESLKNRPEDFYAARQLVRDTEHLSGDSVTSKAIRNAQELSSDPKFANDLPDVGDIIASRDNILRPSNDRDIPRSVRYEYIDPKGGYHQFETAEQLAEFRSEEANNK